MQDHVDTILAQWNAERPDLDVSSMGVLGRLARATAIVEARQAATFSRHGLDPAGFDVLATLRRSGAPFQLTPKQLQASAMVTSSAIAQRLNRLEAAGLIVRSANSQDGRVVDVTLTAGGFALVEEVLPDHVATGNGLLAELSAEQRDQLSALLQVLNGLG